MVVGVTLPDLVEKQLHAVSVDVWQDERVKLRQSNTKFHAVNALKSLNFKIIAAGDNYNDTGMLGAADAGFFIHPPAGIVDKFPQFAVHHSYADLKRSIDSAAQRLRA